MFHYVCRGSLFENRAQRVKGGPILTDAYTGLPESDLRDWLGRRNDILDFQNLSAYARGQIGFAISSRKLLLAKENIMTTFTIDAENNITAYPNATDPSGCNPDLAQFDSQAALAKLSADWPMSRLVEIWNSIPGNTEVSKLADRKKAVARIWKAIQPLAGGKSEAKPAMAAQGAMSGKKAKAAKKAAPAKKAARKPKADRTNKKADVLAMMHRAKGATLDEIMKATGWQRHTVRGFVSILGSKGGEKIESSKNTVGERTYKIAK
jgi:Protein of unknown function (DUF3489)